ncbi:PBP1A family penicillin-binding protein [Dehalobacter sp. DCM]|uniref:transglycosylase domain-containing protein n=1 Tax=Dehalobacter sp. DCM TaxID=2907827 RepID=UPI003081363E|nr:PBP1A family penicillin-binding protein [Dehalobacter sp. DCM]
MSNFNNSNNRNLDQKNRRISSQPKKKRKFTKTPYFRIPLLIIILLFVIIGIYTIVAIAQTPKLDLDVLTGQKESSIVYDSEGKSIAQLHASENRLSVEYEDIPEIVTKTFVAVEDKRFYKHFGFDPIRIVKSAFNNLKAGQVVGGGSTITIQLAKNAFIENKTAQKLSRKIQEAVLAIQIEHVYTKNEILTFYLNRIFLGESSFGIRTASLTYFGKELDELNPAEVALLAGLPQAPSGYDPYVHPEAAKKRRNIVLGVMKENGIITEAEYEKYCEEPFTFVEKVKSEQADVEIPEASSLSKLHPYVVDYVISELQKEYDFTPEQIYTGGLQIYTTVNSDIQDAAEEAFANSDNFPASNDPDRPVQGAMTVLESDTGAISAMVGGREYTPMGLNRAWYTTRQPGSTAKPLVVYSPALEKGGYFPGTVFDDMPVKYQDGSGGVWAPTDYDTISSGWRGLITMREAVMDSVNVYAVKLLESIGVEYAWQFAKNSYDLDLTNNDKVLSMALGTFQISTLQMASAYGTFANNGVKTEPYCVVKVVGPDGEILFEHTPSEKRVMKETTAYMMNDLLRSVVTAGTGTRAQIGSWYICGKTGTSSLDTKTFGNRTGNTDAWFAGYSPKYVGVVWMGYDVTDTSHYMYKVYGGSYPARIWKQVMTVAHQDLPVQSSISRPNGISTVNFDSKSGLLPSSLTPAKFKKTEICASDSIPSKVSDVWVEVKVDPNNPNVLAQEGSLNAITKLCLNVPNRPKDVAWPADEAPYKMPSAYSSQVPTGSETPPAGDSSLPQVSLSSPSYNINSGIVELPLSSYNSKKYSVKLYIKKPGQTYLESYVSEEGNSRSIKYQLALYAQGGEPGTYTFWAALIDNNTYAIGPPSNPVSLTLTLQD